MVVNEDDPSADLKLVKYMVEKGMDFMENQFPNNPEGYRIGFHKPPHNSQYHLHLHLIVLPLKDPKHEITYGANLTKPHDFISQLEKLLAL